MAWRGGGPDGHVAFSRVVVRSVVRCAEIGDIVSRRERERARETLLAGRGGDASVGCEKCEPVNAAVGGADGSAAVEHVRICACGRPW